MFQTNLVRWHPGYTAGEAHENEGSADRAGLVKAKEAILGGVGTDQARHQRADFRQQAIKVLQLRQLFPVRQEKDHQVGAKLGVRFRHLMPRERDDRLYRTFQRREGLILNTKDHRHDRATPSGKVETAVLAGEQLSDLVRFKG